MSDFSERLRQAMKSKGVSAIQLSEATGISRGAISNYLKGRYKPAQTNTYKIAVALNTDPAWLMGKIDNDAQPFVKAVDNSKYFNRETKEPVINNDYIYPFGEERLIIEFQTLSEEHQNMIRELVSLYSVEDKGKDK